ncbi:acyltransferase family protein [Bifidobacterium sp. LC6]|uniref:Acyltransferase family protein n=2 Tax=Bifidobacterium colobi TaxID=2809026 RepID=A0ABS5UX92_9BIFI|nr:acyltransferase family protein [Bifidobacterium colobi]
MWYLQAIVGVYLTLPLLAVMLQWCKRNHMMKYLIYISAGILCLYSLIPTVHKMLALSGNAFTYIPKFSFLVMTGDFTFVLYLVAGWAFHEYRDRLMRGNAVLLSGLVVCCVALLVVSAYYCNVQGDPFEPGLCFLTIILASIAVFGVVIRILAKAVLSQPVKHAVNVVARYSFGLYAIHLPIMSVLNKVQIIPLHGWLLYLAYFAVSFVSSLAIVWLLSKNRIIARYLLLMK